VTYDKFSPKHRAFLTVVTSYVEPGHFSHAVNNRNWRDAMAKEIRSLEENNTWEYAVLLSGKTALGSKWV